MLHRNILYFFLVNEAPTDVAQERLGSGDDVELSVLPNIPFSAGFKHLIFIDLYRLLHVLSSCVCVSGAPTAPRSREHRNTKHEVLIM